MAKLRRAAGIVTLLLALPATGRGQFDDVKIVAEGEPKGHSNHGYLEYRLLVQNNGSERARRVTLSLPKEAHVGRGLDHLRWVRRSVEVGPGQKAWVSLLCPNRPALRGDGVEVAIDGRTWEEVVPLSPRNFTGEMGGHYMRYGSRMGVFMGAGGSMMTTGPLVLYSQRVGEKLDPFLERMRRPPIGPEGPPGVRGAGAPPLPPAGRRGGPGGPAVPMRGGPPVAGGPAGPGGVPPFPGGPGAPLHFGPPGLMHAQLIRADAPVTAWGRHWLSYSRYDGVLVSADDVDDLRRGGPEGLAVLTALCQFAETGGVLLVAGPGQVRLPAGWRRRPDNPGAPGLTRYQAGFGRCFVSADREFATWNASAWGDIDQAWSQTAHPWQSSAGILNLDNVFPIIDDIGVPVRGLFVLMIVFSLAIGPANLLVLGRWKRRIWLLWTAPAISLVTCLAVFGYMIASEGWAGRVRADSFTILDENERRATTLARTAYYSPVTPGDGLRFSTDTEVTALPATSGAGSGSACVLDWGGDQHLSRGWVSARVPAHFALRKSDTARQRVTITGAADGGLAFVNGLGADVRWLWYADAKGRLNYSGPVTAGEKGALKPSDKKLPAERGTVREKVYATADWPTATATIARTPEVVLSPNTYLAELESSPFLKAGGKDAEGLRGARVRAERALVLGILREGGDAR
jgi:hypothetical protein